MNKKQLVAIASILSILFYFVIANIACAKFTDKDLEEEKTCGDYHIKIYRDKIGVGLLVIFKKGKEVYSEEGCKFKIGLIYDDKDMPEASLVKDCKDITGAGVPNLVVSEWSGGAHCCFTFRVFSLGEKFKKIGFIDGGDGDLSKFIDVDHDRALEFVGNDWTFDYWNADFAASPRPEIILKYKDGKYQLAMDLMKKLLPSPTDEEKLLQQVKDEQETIKKNIAEDLKVSKETDAKWDNWIRKDVVIPPLVWTYMLDLIYTGHSKEAWQFLDKVWPRGKPGKEQFIKDFKEQLKKSLYWQTIKNYMEVEDET